MYTEFFGLQKLPFNLTPDPEFLFLSPKHREALAGLRYAVLGRKGFVVLTGDAGTGKTTLLSAVMSQLPTGEVLSSILLNPTLTPSEFIELLMLDFGITDIPASKAQRLWRLQGFLLEAYRNDRTAILVIDEAHKLSAEVLEEIRLLGNYEYGADKFLQIVLLGQCELDDLLDRHELRQFKQRIALRLYIDPLTAAEAAEYIRFRWAKAGGASEPPITPEAIEGVVRWSGGIPRLINSICDAALLMAYGDASASVGMHYIRDAAMNLALIPSLAAPVVPVQPVVTPLPAEEVSSPKLGPVEVPPRQNTDSDLSELDNDIPSFARFALERKNSSILQRLAGKLGFPK
ncbi:MAG: AAA family ATPase [Bryobacteraceae bacterium]|jgi:general secretion pathway protein A